MPTGFFKGCCVGKEWDGGAAEEEVAALTNACGLLVIIVTGEAGSVCKHSIGPGEVLAWALVSSENDTDGLSKS